MDWLKGILNAIGLIRDVFAAVREFAAFVEKNKQEQWFQDAAIAFRGMRGPSGTEDKRRAIEGIRDLLKRL
jgi:hypothetical protein